MLQGWFILLDIGLFFECRLHALGDARHFVTRKLQNGFEFDELMALARLIVGQGVLPSGAGRPRPGFRCCLGWSGSTQPYDQADRGQGEVTGWQRQVGMD